MSSLIMRRLESIVKKRFYKTYNIISIEKEKYIIRGGIVRDANNNNKHKDSKNKRKKYCATKYMSID